MSLGKVSILIGISYFVKIVSALIVNKFLAIFIGPSGIALVGQFRSFVQMATTLSTAGINSGVVKLIAQHKQTDRKKVFEVQQISLSLTLIASISFSILIFVFNNTISNYLFKTTEYSIFISVFSISLVFFSLNRIFLFFINGEGDTNLYTKINIIQSLIVLVLSVILVYFYRFEGALFVIGFTQVIVSFISLYYIQKKKFYNIRYFQFLLKDKKTKILLSYSLITIASAASVALAQIAIRNILIERFGTETTGQWQAVWSISEVYLGFITMFLSIHYYPIISSLLNEKLKLLKEIKKIAIFVAIISAGVIIVTFLLKKYIVLILFSDSFLDSLIFFKFQLIGDFFKIISWVFGYYLLSITATKAIIISTIISNLLFVVLTYYLTEIFGVIGVNYSYAIVYAAFLSFTIIYTKSKLNV